ncbi:KN motif and ankyrin repeat domain-containing protein 4 [Lampris incognitus]|uniref:KN motif and ankyrin repeat domain-containing protein 4 n=1 Tax=Lampris incognitus TaxID=2546036 RepID=UPI0024B54721|nr:KN motif and ankyrin repeat domain-containing protein 4 [Lampris incognitus]
MDKKSANGFSSKDHDGGVQKKQLPYSVETPYGFHLDLDFLKYVDDIEKGHTIKRVHIQRRVKGPKFSTLPRNFSLPGHGPRPAPKEKDTAWSGTSTLGPKPKSRVTEVQQIFDFKPSDGGMSSQSNKGTTSQGPSYVLGKPREEVSIGARGFEEKPLGLQGRPNLLRASSMPITVQHRKGSDSSSPDRVVGTPENGSSENVFRASSDITDRRSVPQDRTGLHQQITVALKRVRELEEQVKTIPELKAQICSLREEREQLLLQLQAQAKAQASTSSSISTPRSPGGLSPAPKTQPEGVFEALGSVPLEEKMEKEKQGVLESIGSQIERGRYESVKTSKAQREVARPSEQEEERQILPGDKSDGQTVPLGNLLEHAREKLSQDGTAHKLTTFKVTIKEEKLGHYHIGGYDDLASVQQLQGKLTTLEAKLTQASQELERTNMLLEVQTRENKLKEEKILQLSEGVRVEVCATERESRVRRESMDMGMETERVDFPSQETETESPGTIDQGTDTERICIEVHVPRAESVEQPQIETERVATNDQVIEMAEETAVVCLARPRANSVDQGTETERVETQDQMTATPVAERINQVTETEGEMVTDHPVRPRASSVDQGTETERVDTIDRVTETEAAQRTDQQTETEVVRDRQQDNNPARAVEAESQIAESVSSQITEDRTIAVNERLQNENTYERIDGDNMDGECVVTNYVTETSGIVTESVANKNVASDNVADKGHFSQTAAMSKTREAEAEIKQITLPSDSEKRDILPPYTTVTTEIVEAEQTAVETVKDQQTVASSEMVCFQTKKTAVTDNTVVVSENLAVNSEAPVRPQRGRKPTTDQPQPSQLELQAPPLRPRRGSSDTQPQPSELQKPTQPKAQVPAKSQLQAQKSPKLACGESSDAQIQQHEPQTSLNVQTQSQAGASSEVQSQLQPQSSSTQPVPQTQSPKPSEAQTQYQTKSSAPRRDSKELPLPHKGASESQSLRHGSREAQVSSTHRGSSETYPQSQGPRRGSSDAPALRRGSGESQPLRKGSSDSTHHRGITETQAPRRDVGEAQPTRRGSSESPTSPAALGQVVNRITGLLGEQWAQLGSSSGAQQAAGQQEISSTQKQTPGKRAGAGKGASAKPAGKAASAATTGKPAGKPGPSKMSSIQSQLVSSLSVLSAFYSPGQKAAAANKQQEQGLKSIMKKNSVADKQRNGGAKKNLKFVGVNGGYETTSSEESSGDEKTRAEDQEEEDEEDKDSSKPEEEQSKEPPPAEEAQEGLETQWDVAETLAQHGSAVARQQEDGGGPQDPEPSQFLEFQEETATGGQVDQGFMDACLYVRDRMEEVSSPDKEMRQVLLALYQEWFRVSSQKDSLADTVTLYLRQVSMVTPSLLPYVVNLTDGNGNTALHYSVSHSNFSVVKLLLDTGLCETDNVNKAGYTAVMLAALTAADSPDDLEVAQQLLTQGDVNARSSQAGQTALMLAVSHGRVAMVKLLLTCGSDVNAQDRDGSTALMCACEHGHTRIVRQLLETGCCDTSFIDKDGQTALSVATGASHNEIVDLLKAHTEAAASDPPSSTCLL